MTSQPFFTGARGGRRGRTILSGPPGSAGLPGRVLAVLTALVAALGIAFVYAPRFVAAAAPGGGFSDQRSLIGALRDAFVGYWGSADRSFAPPMQRIIDYWVVYHVAKAVTAALGLAVLIMLAVVLGRMYLRTGLGVRSSAVVASAWSVTAMLALFSAAVVAANIQGAVAPFSSLLSMLPAAQPDERFTATLDQVRQGLVQYSSADGRTSPALKRMVDDFALYHAVMVVVAVIMALALIALSVRAWKRFCRARGDQRARRAYAAVGAGLLVAALAVIVIGAANATTVAAPAPALLAAFQGGR